jgi:hypothetical protein
MLPIIGEVGKLRNATQISYILIRLHSDKEMIGTQACGVLSTRMLRRKKASHIPFKNPKPIINNPFMHITIQLATFTKSFGAGQFYIDLVDNSYNGLRERITRVASAQTTVIGKKNTFGPRWRFICLISTDLIIGTASIDQEIFVLKRS